MKYRLNKAEKVPVTLYNVAKTREYNGKPIVTYRNQHRFVPGEVYETDDEAMLEWFRTYKRKVRYNSDLAKTLTEAGVPFELEMCRSCGGKVKKISYQIIEVYDE